MGQSTEPQTKTIYQNPRLPLAVYREIIAHLTQVTGVEASLLAQSSTSFDYTLSQVEGLQVVYTEATDAESQQRVGQILDYYGDRYGSWDSKDEE